MKLAFVCVSMLVAACGGTQNEPEAPSSTAVAVPEATDAGMTAAEPPPREPGAEPAPSEEPVRASVRVEVSSDGGVVLVKSAPDSGVKVWGSTQRFDGGFTFQGGFSFGKSDAGP